MSDTKIAAKADSKAPASVNNMTGAEIIIKALQESGRGYRVWLSGRCSTADL